MKALLLRVLAAALPIAAQQQIDGADFLRQTSDGTVVQGPDAPVSFRLPASWELRQGQRWGNHQTTLWFADSASRAFATLYYQYPLDPPPTGDADTALRKAINDKVQQRQAAFPDYHVRTGSIRKQQIGGQPAMSYIGDYNCAGRTTARVHASGFSVRSPRRTSSS